jgi:signal transduction histidine kinase
LNRFDRITIASRAFCLAAVLGLAAVSGNLVAIQGTMFLGAIAATAAFVALTTRTHDASVATGEAVLAALLIGLALPSAAVLLPYLLIPTLIAGAARGFRAALWVTLAEGASLVAITVLPWDPQTMRQYELAAPWLVTALGTGMLGSVLRQMNTAAGIGAADESYESARRLVTQLRTVARRLSAGLDAVGMSSQLLAVVHGHLGDTRAAVFVRTDGGVLTPLGRRGVDPQDNLLPTDDLVHACWSQMMPAHSVLTPRGPTATHRIALPLRAGDRMIGVVLADAATMPAKATLDALMRQIDEHALRIDTALTFDEVRTIATTEERRRLAREIHDGVAQEIASLGYAVDDLAADAVSPSQQGKLAHLRGELTRVVSELRLSIFDLRSDVDPSSGLGSALSDYVRQVGSRSGMTVHLTLDEAPTRLRRETETELLRIAQEAITNARRHSGARNLWVDCRVHPPSARLEVRDDGGGLRQGRDDSYGLRIMKERAHRIDATLHIDGSNDEDGTTGTLVRVSLGETITSGSHR